MLALRLVAGLLWPRLSFSKLSKALSSGKVSVSATVANSQNLSLSMSRTKTRYQFCLLEQDFLKLIFFGSFRSVQSFGINSSVNLGMPFRVYSAEVFGNEIRCQPYSTMNSVHSSFSHDLSPPLLFPHFSVLIHFPSSLSLFALLLSLSLHLNTLISLLISL